ncbi:ADP-ribosyltransferase [Flavobacterium enshiense]|uniref:ADP-ribosyltransferase n=1 Tax=Flavobacterium enshiense TaxID=1341165 RepID=UPI00345C9281
MKNDKNTTKININPEQIIAIKVYVNSSTDSFTEEEKIEAFDLSTNGFTFQLNAILRANLNLSSKVNKYLSTLDSAFSNQQTTVQQTVYRGCNYQEMLRYLMNGHYLDLGYMSTSKSADSTEKFFQTQNIGYKPAFLKIHIPSQSNVLDLEMINDFDNSTYEDEILFKRKSLFEVIENRTVGLNYLLEEFDFKLNQDYDEIQFLELRYSRNL